MLGGLLGDKLSNIRSLQRVGVEAATSPPIWQPRLPCPLGKCKSNGCAVASERGGLTNTRLGTRRDATRPRNQMRQANWTLPPVRNAACCSPQQVKAAQWSGRRLWLSIRRLSTPIYHDACPWITWSPRAARHKSKSNPIEASNTRPRAPRSSSTPPLNSATQHPPWLPRSKKCLYNSQSLSIALTSHGTITSPSTSSGMSWDTRSSTLSSHGSSCCVCAHSTPPMKIWKCALP